MTKLEAIKNCVKPIDEACDEIMQHIENTVDEYSFCRLIHYKGCQCWNNE